MLNVHPSLARSLRQRQMCQTMIGCFCSMIACICIISFVSTTPPTMSAENKTQWTQIHATVTSWSWLITTTLLIIRSSMPGLSEYFTSMLYILEVQLLTTVPIKSKSYGCDGSNMTWMPLQAAGLTPDSIVCISLRWLANMHLVL